MKQSQIKNGLSCLMSILVIMSLSGCWSESGSQSLSRYLEQVKARPAVPVEPIPAVIEPVHFAYSASQLRSPFEIPQLKIAKNSGLSPQMDRPQEPLEAFPIDALALVGMLTLGSAPWALIAAPDNTLYRVTIGQYVGQDYGKITDMSKEAITIEEIVPDGVGGWRNKQRLISLNDKAG